MLYRLWKGIQALDTKVFVTCKISAGSGRGRHPRLWAERLRGFLLLALLGSRSPLIHGRLLRAEQVRSQWVVSKILNENRFHWLFWFPKFIFLWINFSEGSCLFSRRKGNLLTHMAKASLFLITIMWCYPVIFWKAKNCSSEKALSSKNCDLKDKYLLTGVT